MKIKFSKKQIEIIEQIDDIVSEMRRCELDYDKEIIIDLCMYGEVILELYYDDVYDDISDNLMEMIIEINLKLDELFQGFEERENFIKDIIYDCLDRFVNNYILGYIRTTYKENKTGKYADLIINVLKEAQFIDKTLSHVYVNHNFLEQIMIYGVNAFYDEFGVNVNQLHDELIIACNTFQNQFEKDFPSMKKFNGKYINYIDDIGFGTRMFIRNIINNITKYLYIETKPLPIYIDLNQITCSSNKTIYLKVFIGQRKFGRFIYQHQFKIKSKIKKSVLNNIVFEVENQINNGIAEYNLDYLLDVLEEKLGVAA